MKTLIRYLIAASCCSLVLRAGVAADDQARAIPKMGYFSSLVAQEDAALGNHSYNKISTQGSIFAAGNISAGGAVIVGTTLTVDGAVIINGSTTFTGPVTMRVNPLLFTTAGTALAPNITTSPATNLAVDTGAAGTLLLGIGGASGVSISKAGATTTINGVLTVAQNPLTFSTAGAAGAPNITSTGANALAIDTAGAAALILGATNANAVNISRTGITTTVNGPLTMAVNPITFLTAGGPGTPNIINTGTNSLAVGTGSAAGATGALLIFTGDSSTGALPGSLTLNVGTSTSGASSANGASLTLSGGNLGGAGSSITLQAGANGGGAGTGGSVSVLSATGVGGNGNVTINCTGAGAGGNTVFMPNLPTTVNPANLVVDAGTGQLSRSTSSLRYKTNVTPVNFDSSKVSQLQPVSFTSKTDTSPSPRVAHGFIAEAVANVFPQAVMFDREGRPDSLDYNCIITIAIKAIQDLQARVAALEAA